MNGDRAVTRRATLKQLRSFCEVAERGGFNAAAQVLHATQPAISGHIRQLEDALGVMLLERTTRSVELTYAGRQLLPRLRGALANMDAVLTEVSALSPDRRAHVSIAAAGSVVAMLLAPVVAVLRETHRDLTMSVIETNGDHVRRLVQDGEVSLGVTTVHEPCQGPRRELDSQPLIADRFGILMAKQHPLTLGERALDWSMLAGAALVVLTEENSMRRLIDEAIPADAGGGPRLEVSIVHAAVALAGQGGCVAILPALCARAFGTASTVFRLVEGPEIWRNVGVVCRRDVALSAVDAQLLKSIRTYVQVLASADALHLRVP